LVDLSRRPTREAVKREAMRRAVAMVPLVVG
jgi:hypothetical protein